MKEADPKARNAQRLTECHPTLAASLTRVITRLEGVEIRPRIQDVWRSPQDQLTGLLNGSTKVKFGFHNVTGADGRKESLAVDLLDDDPPLAPGAPYVLRLAAAAEGLATGALWGLPTKLKSGTAAAIAAGDFDAPVKVGCDPCHVEPTGITIAQAKVGKRPL
ncbi:hypothetical protein ACQW02_09980 [Humitalea sp. 24SJ18S-53]|uniref:hypothetical protein n=1 Tax=Humitalea sp. 24SJ18S-53 TaxID=3422307 RepID=UPI003D67A2E0